MNQEDYYFPTHLLDSAPELRKQYFREYEVLHPRLKLISDKILQIIREPGGTQLIFLVGPTGVGKSFLLRWLVSEIEYEWSLIQHTDPGRIPVASMEVPSKDTKNPTWKDFYIRVLEALEEKHIDKKVSYADVSVDIRYDDGERKVVIEDATIRKYRRAVESCFRHRRPSVFFLDEAHQLINTGGLRVQEQMENLKSIANMTRTLHGLFGTYKLLDLLGLDDDEESDQLIRRSAILHFRRYLGDEGDLFVFNSIINSFQANMPFKKAPDLNKHSDFLYKRTLGCIGILRDWLVAAYTEAVNEGAVTLEYKHLKKTCIIAEARGVKMLQQFIRSERELERILDSDEEDYENLLREAGRREIAVESKYVAESDTRSRPAETNGRKRGSKTPGKQNPKRRPIGGKRGPSS